MSLKPLPSANADRPRGRADCIPIEQRGKNNLPLPVITDPDARPGKFRPGKWRAVSLSAVHLLIILHLVHWWYAGSTLTPVEPSEAKDFSMSGQINAGFIFFAFALGSTAILGRWFCGWGCHLIAYQDLTLWILKKLHLRPKAFRTRFFVFIPLVAAIYLFFWPSLQRFWFGMPHPPIELHLAKSGFWDTFPGPVFAVLTILITGGVMIYLLGPKAFCTNACPYGAFFAPLDKLAPMRIRVTDDCHQCGKCTAACTSNVSVADEVRLFKAVVDPGCMKTLDCIRACPNDALYAGFGAPAIGKQPIEPRKPRAFDLTLGEELAALVLFAIFLFAIYGLYGTFPFLLSLGMAAVGAWLGIKALQLLYKRDVLLQRTKLKIAGRIAPRGLIYAACMIALWAFVAHSAVWRYHDFRGNAAFLRAAAAVLDWQYDPAFVDHLSAEQRGIAEQAAHHLNRSAGWGLFHTPSNDAQLAWALLLTGQPRVVVEPHICAAVEAVPENTDLRVLLAAILTWFDDTDAAQSQYQAAIEIDRSAREPLEKKGIHEPSPQGAVLHREWGRFLETRGDLEAAAIALKKAVDLDPKNIFAWIAWGDFCGRQGEIDLARRAFIRAIQLDRHDPRIVERLAYLRGFEPQNFAAALRDYEAALAAAPDIPLFAHGRAYALFQLDRADEAVRAYEQFLRAQPAASDARAEYGAILLVGGDVPGAIREYEHILRDEPSNAEASLRLATLYAQAGRIPEARDRLVMVGKNGNESQKAAARELLNQISAASSQPR